MQIRFLSVFVPSILAMLFLSKLEPVIRRHDVADNQYISFATAGFFDPIGFVICNQLRSTGTLISPRTVLVSAHAILHDHPAIFSIYDPIQEKTVRVRGRAIRHEQYCKKTNEKDQITSLYNDIGLIILDHPITTIPPAKFWNGSIQQNQICYCAGYGRAGTGSTGPKDRDYIKRGFTNSFDGIISNESFDTSYAIIFYSPDDHYHITELEGIGSEGDSGAPIMIQDGDSGEYMIAGILTLLSQKGYYHSYNTILPTIYFSDWIEKNKY